MASTQSLLGLVSQLQNMETCFTSILMEGAMKLSALSDAKIFILVETAEGRRFCGKRHLCDQYIRGGGLVPIGNDLELDVDTSVSAIRERTSVFQAQEHVQVEGAFCLWGFGLPSVSVSPEDFLYFLDGSVKGVKT